MAQSVRAQSVRARVQPTQVLAGLVAVAFLVFGIVGFSRTGFGDFTGHDHGTLAGFAINPLHNLVHVLFGVVGLLLVLTSATSRLYGWILLAGYGVLLAWGLVLVGLTSTNPVSQLGNPLNLNIADNWLHLGLAVVGLIIAVAPARRKIVVEEPEPVVVNETVTEPVPAQQPAVTTDRPVADRHVTDRPEASTDRPAPQQTETVATEEEKTTSAKPRGLHRLSSRLRDRSAH